MYKIKVLHVAVHLGGGAGKAIVGMIISAGNIIDSSVVLLEEPRNNTYVDQLKKKRISVNVERDAGKIRMQIMRNDLTVMNWWGHPLMIRLLMEMPNIYGRFMIWNHINGCSYPYLNGGFLEQFDKILFTTYYSLKNPMWRKDERRRITEKSAVVYGTGNYDPAKISPKTKYFEKSELTIGYVGTMSYAKLHSHFLDYYKEIIDKYQRVRFVMLGEPSEEVLQTIRESGLEAYFELPGYVNNVMDYLKKMDVFAYFLNEESYATTENSLLEAMAVGLPVIVLDNPVERCIVYHRVNGLLINDPTEFTNCVDWLLTENNGRRLGESARKFCIDHYSVSANLRVFYSSCKDLMQVKEREHVFGSTVGKTPFDAFCMQAVSEKELFRHICDGQIESIDRAGIRSIYLEKEKGSVFQFLRYFPESEELRKIARFIKQYEN